MRSRLLVCAAATGAVAAAFAFTGTQPPPPPPSTPIGAAVAADDPKPVAGQNDNAAAEREAILTSARDFAAAFNKGDAKAVAGLLTEGCECQDAGGEVIRGRVAVEKAYADFFRANPGARIEVRVESVRFPGADLAIEDGVLRLTRAGGSGSSTVYTTTHVREGGRWRVAVSKEWGVGTDSIEDLDWLIGTWKASVGDQEVTLTVTRDGATALRGRFVRLAQGKGVTSGNMRIALDPQSGQLRSWHDDDTGGHGQALWARDGGNWVLDSFGVLGDGTETAAVNILRRVGENDITWRSIDRVAGDKEAPDTVPLRLTRVVAPK